MSKPLIRVVLSAVFLSGLSLPLAACAEPSAPPAAPPLPVLSSTGNLAGTVVGNDRLALAGQPTLADLDDWAAAGVTTVVNMRSQAETGALEFDTAHEVGKRGMVYVEIPMGGADGVSPEIVEALGLTLDATEGKVVVHCRSGTRAAHAYGALLVSRGVLPQDALDDNLGWIGPLSHSTIDALLGR